MVQFIDDIMSVIFSSLIGGTATQAVLVGTLILISMLVLLLLVTRIGLDVALVIVSPAIIIASFAGLLPPLSLGVIILVLAFFWAGIILALVR